MSSQEYGFSKTLADTDLNETIAKVTAALKTEGFGVLTEIDVKATFKKKLDVDFRPYVILGACNPVLAHKALLTDEQIGLLLPCNVVVQAVDGGCKVSFVDPMAMMGFTGNEALNEVATEANAKLRRVAEKL